VLFVSMYQPFPAIGAQGPVAISVQAMTASGSVPRQVPLHFTNEASIGGPQMFVTIIEEGNRLIISAPFLALPFATGPDSSFSRTTGLDPAVVHSWFDQPDQVATTLSFGDLLPLIARLPVLGTPLNPAANATTSVLVSYASPGVEIGTITASWAPATAVPEPATVVQLAIAAAGLGGYGWRRRVTARS
jgi:hypothetical protein